MNAITKIMSRLELSEKPKKASILGPKSAEITCPDLQECTPILEPKKRPQTREQTGAMNNKITTRKTATSAGENQTGLALGSVINRTAATASKEWIAARNQYINHLMVCRACYAPVNRYCDDGDVLRQQYNQTPEA